MSRFSCLLILSALAFAGSSAALAEPQRIVSIGGSVTEVLYAVGLKDKIVGIDTTSLYPPEAIKTKPNVGYLRALSPEGVLGLSPDLIIMERDAGPREAVALLDEAGVPVVHVPAGFELSELPEKIRAITNAVGKNAEGDKIASTVAEDLAALKNDLAKVTAKKRVLFILSLTDGRPMAAGTNTAADAIIRLAGAENVFGDVKGYKTISPEAAAALQPDAILMITRSGAPQEGTDILKQPAFVETPAAKTGTFIKMDGLFLLGFGPRTPAAARDLAAKLYPDLKLANAQ
ncbi:hemin ABC transporter substrate-binding protein [Terrihabitans soli]|uniref:Hemin ABC transporter substrate-binding protein n=1 Tax=Terrihabitans soli TaxID=708113 RepID=A0A6S6QY49_9HYPH|nr:ABC transporter substrate-binding protein [Terrihabitans soli]BCJ92202.1 hemin ABC transporter substrate-binding protein [Terrihabitans soli]